ncbi:Na+/H+ antiporter NhaC family protein [Flavonifractor hominis]|uniref:Na+/H+ antiporter NhaC family protein n=1 Tax=Flavonifractor hominis TaxID=3133178 RepID=A0ABV1EQU2_9FIRM
MEEIVNYGWLSLIPAIVAVVLAFATRNVVMSLAISLFLGIMIQVGGNPWLSLQDLFSEYLFVDLATDNNPQTIVMMISVGGFVALIEKSGGARAFAKAVANSVNSKVKAQLAAWVGGLVIFFSDSGNSLILGPMFRPIFDRLKVSRAKLSYILDSTSSPVCILIPITGWGVYVMSIIATEYEALGINGSDMETFMAAIPYQFYAILALCLIPIVAFGKHDFAFMAKAEEQARLGLPQKVAGEETILVSEDRNVSPWNMILPLIVLLGTILIMFLSWGFPFQNIPGSKIRIALTSGYLLASIVCMIMIVAQKLMSFKETFDVFIGGMQKMTSVLVVVVLAWGVGSVCKDLGTSQFIVDSTLGVITPHVVPALLFAVGVVISFATGTSWGSMAILLPIGINMAVGFEVSIPMTVGAILSGCLFGDHCSPISDTTVMSAMAAGSDLLEHTRTQLPYAGIAALASLVGYLILGFTGANIWIMLPVALVLLVVFYLLSCKFWGVKSTEAEQ